MTDSPVSVLGGGSIGVSFAILFATKGFDVKVYDPIDEALTRATDDLALRLHQLHAHGGLAEDVAAVTARIRFTTELASALWHTRFVQECAPERVDLKQALLSRAAELTESDVPLSSSSSAIVPSELARGLAPESAARILVGHPGNPPYLLPIVEVVPAPSTSPAIVTQTVDMYRSAGMRPVLVRREVEGFVFNRLQGALLREAYCLVREGVATVDDVDEVVRSGLGLRWSVIGPFETSDLNTRGGIASHAVNLGPAYERMGAERGQRDPWTAELVSEVTAQRRALLDLADWDERVRWRDRKLIELRGVVG